MSELPPVTLLRAFDAAGRHGSFKAAAAFLSVTPSTISHQIADLEAYLGVQLFERLARGLKLTAEGSTLLADVAIAFEHLRAATARLRVAGQASTLRLSANPFFANEILSPRLAAFETAFPNLSVHVSSTEALEDPRDGSVDFCVRFGGSDTPGLARELLYQVEAAPVIGAQHGPEMPARIDCWFNGTSAWQQWRNRSGAELKLGKLRSFNTYNSAMRAVDQGLGVALAMLPITEPWLSSGRVIRFNNLPSVPLGPLFLVHRPLRASQTTLRAARDWWVNAIRRAAQDEIYTPE